MAFSKYFLLLAQDPRSSEIILLIFIQALTYGNYCHMRSCEIMPLGSRSTKNCIILSRMPAMIADDSWPWLLEVYGLEKRTDQRHPQSLQFI